MIRSLRKRHRWTFVVLAIVLLFILLRALDARADWPQDTAVQDLDSAHSATHSAPDSAPQSAPQSVPAEDHI